jgi:hypothetical protein
MLRSILPDVILSKGALHAVQVRTSGADVASLLSMTPAHGLAHAALLYNHEFVVEYLRVPADMKILGTKLTPYVNCCKPSLRCLLFLPFMFVLCSTQRSFEVYLVML